MFRAGMEVKSRTDYILGTDRHLFWNFSVRDSRHNSDHYLVLGCLWSAPLSKCSECLGRRKRPPLRPPTTPMREGGIFAALRRASPKPKARDAHKNAWILETTWRLVNKRVSACQDPARDQSLIRRLGRSIAEILKENCRRRAEKAGEEVERLLGLDPILHRKAPHQMKEWYRAAVERVPPPARVTLQRITAERVYLYRYVPHLGENIPVSVDPFLVNDLVPTEGKIEWAVK